MQTSYALRWFRRPSLFVVANTRGQGLTEYLILMILISVISISAARGLGSTIQRKIKMVTNQINTKVDLGNDD